jgi:SpoIVB peptidase S55
MAAASKPLAHLTAGGIMPLCPTSKVPRGVRRASTVAVAVATIATTTIPGETVLASSTEGLLPAQADPCPAAFPIDELTAGQALEGLTVDSGTTPEPFTATVIGVLEDAVAPGFPLVIATATSPAIDEAGGIWGGMSGSPVYAADGRLVGAIAYGFAGSSPIAGITPFSAMAELLSGGGPEVAASKVDLTAALEKKLVASGEVTANEAASGLTRLTIPVGVSGMSGRPRRVNRMIKRHLHGVRIYAAGRASAEPAQLELVPGGNVGVALSYGDVTVGGVGTVTAVCGDEALLFGHPATHGGATTLSAHEATAVFVQPDPVFGPFKLANLGGVAGTVDQDRLAGLRTELGVTPDSTPVRTTLTAVDRGTSRTGVTNVVLPDFVADAAAGHVFSNIDRVHDRIGGGVVELEWSASGKRADGSTWRLRRHEKFADPFDVAFPPADATFFNLFFLQNNPFEAITVDNVTATGTVDPVYRQSQLVGVEKLGADGRWQALSRRTPVRLVAGSEVFLRGVLRRVRSTQVTRVQLSLVVPRLAGGTGSLNVSAGQNEFIDPTEGAENFNDVLAALDSAPAGDTLRARLVVDRGEQTIRREGRATAPIAMFGELGFNVRVISAA